ncbi:hypothetical protein [Plantactinospora sp. BB1]|uniref:hypothetical protein n=1 Tax=Plantactinospora sp. BB1 TaxID=2071627 RepID=UPI00131F05ED|nr:hypothetical protein [Plantactinospora sp. BB1]
MSSVREVVAQLLTVVERLDRAAVGVTRAQAEAEQAQRSFAEVGRGTNHRAIRTGVAASSEATAKSGKVARLLAEAASHFAAYANQIAPGSVSSRDKATESTPPGDQIVNEAASGRDGFRRFAKRVADKADSVGETGKKVADILAEARPAGTASTTQQLPPTPRNPTAAGTPGDAAHAIVVTAAAVVAVALKAASLRKQRKEQTRD